MNYLLDTSACIAIINGRPLSVRQRFRSAINANAAIAISSICGFELWFGVANSLRRDYNSERLEGFLAGPVDMLPFDHGDARTAGEVRAALQARGTPIGAYDLLVASQAIHRGMMLVTANVSEFARVDGLVCEDWSRGGATTRSKEAPEPT